MKHAVGEMFDDHHNFLKDILELLSHAMRIKLTITFNIYTF